MTRAEMHREIRNLAKKSSEISTDHVRTEHTVNLLRLIGGHKNIIAYGAGWLGAQFADLFSSVGDNTKIVCFLDRAADEKTEHCGYPVYKADDLRVGDELRENATVILTLNLEHAEHDKLEHYLRTLGYRNIVVGAYWTSLNYMLVNYGRECGITSSDAEEASASLDLMFDEHSRDVFMSVFRAQALLEFDLPIQSPGMTQYFNVDVPFRNKYRNFVDCGAYIGDTFIDLVQHGHKPENYFGFEPDMGNYAEFVKTLDNLIYDGHTVALPLGVGDQNSFLRFHADNSGSSKIGELGNTTIQTVRIDDVIRNYDDLMIKMDVEGAEIAALNGAKKVITQTKPDLAICVYHRASDLWRIPLMLKEWVPEYRFYLRNHARYTGETVLYCTI